MAGSRFILAVAAAIVLGGCSGVRQNLNGWFGKPPPDATAASSRQGQTFYAAVAGMTVHAEASMSSDVVGRLALHEKVTRSRLEHGYAYVTADASGIEGWVDNAQLLWRLPAANSAQPGENQAQSMDNEAPGAGTTDGALGSEPTPVALPAPTSTPALQSAPLASPTTPLASPLAPAPSQATSPAARDTPPAAQGVPAATREAPRAVPQARPSPAPSVIDPF